MNDLNNFDSDEYLCPRCSHQQQTPGTCPHHKTPLMNFSAWVEFKKKPSNEFRISAIIFILIFIVLFLYFAMKGDGNALFDLGGGIGG
jgi:hypothetical protein